MTIPTAGQLRHLSGWKRDLPDHRDMLFSVSKPMAIPGKASLRSKTPLVEDQGDIGSCTAHAATSAMEYLYKKQGKTSPQLSRLFLYYATRVWTEKIGAADDSGAMIRDVMKTLRRYGTCLETTWPYLTSKFSLAPSPEAKTEALKHQILFYYRCPNLRSAKMTIASGYPVVGGFSVPSSMMGPESEKTGIVKYPDNDEDFVGGHAVLFVGYDDTTKMLCFVNSWGSAWGDHGFGYLPYEFVDTGLASDFWTIRSAEL